MRRLTRAIIVSAVAGAAAGMTHAEEGAGPGEEAAAAKAEAPGWHIEAVAEGGYGPVIALDSHDRPHIVYEWGRGVKYVYWTGSSWVTIAGPVPKTEGRYFIISFALDRDDRPHIILHMIRSAGQGEIAYGRWTGSEWLTETVDAADPGRDYWFFNFVLDRQDCPHIAYLSVGEAFRFTEPTDVKYARRADAGWDVETVVASEDELRAPTLAVDSRGRAYIVYFYDTGGGEYALPESGLVCARWTGNAWDIQTVDGGTHGGALRQCTAVAIDDQDCPHVAYSYGNLLKRDLKYARWTGREWELRTVDADARVGDSLTRTLDEIAISLDNAGRPHVAYYDGLRGDLKYAHETGERWEVETVDAEEDAGFAPFIAVGPDGYAHILYRTSTRKAGGWGGALKYARRSGEGWATLTVDGEGGDGSLAVDSRSRPRIAYTYYGPSAQIRYATWAGGEMKSEPRAEREAAIDKSAEVIGIRWEPAASLLDPAEPWRPVISINPWYALSKDVYAEPPAAGEGPASLVPVPGEIDEAAPVEVIAGRSVWTDLSDVNVREGYDTWLKFKQAETEGWHCGFHVRPDFITPYATPYEDGNRPIPVAVVRFGLPYSAVREGPALEFPPVKEAVQEYGYGEWEFGPEVPAGSCYEVVARCGDWFSAGSWSSGWVPADAPGLERYYLTCIWPYPFPEFYNEDSWFAFYLPFEGDVERLIYCAAPVDDRSYLPYEDPVVTVTTAGGAFDATPRSLGGYDYFGGLHEYFEAVLAEAVKREDVESITFAAGRGDERMKVVFDPREAWAEYDAQR